ncbi:MAG: adenosylcobalamin-dependent ribonucleoside-diphosphate reductase, partial [bacterium]|nr:adenosylcobalamin-dependent ribonucleoside-diphosphate reductase [bacterium]
VTDEFMRAVVERPNEQWYCTWKGEKTKPHKVIRATNGSVVGAEDIDITAKQIFDELVLNAWTNGEPGIVFIDEVNRTNPLPGLGKIGTSNPCGEQFLHPYDNCNLGSLNLAAFVKHGKKGASFDWAGLKHGTRLATRLMDNVIDLFDFPVPQVTELAQKNRRIGLGIMGFADTLYALNIPYNSEAGRAMGERLMKTVTDTAHAMSQVLAAEKGAFPNISLSVYAKKKPLRNAALTTVAPTGSISMMFDCSSGIEPNFALYYVKQDKDGHQYPYFNKYFKDALGRHKLSPEVIAEVEREVMQKGSIQSITSLPQEFRDAFVVAMDISADDHMAMQAAFQRHVDNSISKTINFPNSATREDVARGFIAAWRSKCKSATVYRDGSRHIQILNLGASEIISPTEVSGKKEDKETALAVDRSRLEPRTRPDVMSGNTYRIKTGYGNLYITINNDEQGAPFEIFATIGKTGGFYQEQSEAICRLVSLALRTGTKVENVIDNLKGIRGPMPVITNRGTVLSLPDAIGRILEEHVKRNDDIRAALKLEETVNAVAHIKSEEAPTATLASAKRDMADIGMMPGCPDCGGPLQMGEGCMSCKSCGFSRCM